MRCPACKERVISFLNWSQGANAFCKCDCPHCGAPLRVSRRTILVFLLVSLLSVPLVVGIAASLSALDVSEPTARWIFGFVMIPLVGIAAYLVWRTGFYTVRDNVPQKASSDHPRAIATSEPSGLRLLFVAATAAGLIVFMLSLGRHDLLLAFDKQTSAGRITAIRSPTPGGIRMSDYHITYEFTDSGLVYSGEDVLPPKHPPPQDGKILIVYSRRDPSVSRIASQLSGTLIAGILFGVGLLLWSVVQFVRLHRRPSPSIKQGKTPLE